MSTFPEEPLNTGIYFSLLPGQRLNEGRYEIVRKLGWGRRATVWLAVDLTAPEESFYRVIKVLTTLGTEVGSIQEHGMLESVESVLDGLPSLLESFTETNRHTGGKHQCFVIRDIMTSVETLRREAPHGRLSTHIVQSIVHGALEKLEELHKISIIYGGLTTRNIAFGNFHSTADLRPVLAQMSPVVVRDFVVDGVSYKYVESEPVPHNHSWKDTYSQTMGRYFICLNNLSGAQEFGEGASWEKTGQQERTIRPPEAILDGFFDDGVDIWTLGCATFMLLTGKPLFEPTLSDQDQLVRMAQLAGQPFDIDFLEDSKRYEQFRGFLPLEKSQLSPQDDPSVEKELALMTSLCEQEINDAAEFIRLCLQLDPTKRPTCEQLEEHSWLEIGRTCSCGWCSDL